MQAILLILTAIASVVGGLVAAALLCWLLWHLFTPIRHPEWAPLVILILTWLALVGKLPDSEFLHMTLAFAMVAAVPFWIAGRTWRNHYTHAADTVVHPYISDQGP